MNLCACSSPAPLRCASLSAGCALNDGRRRLHPRLRPRLRLGTRLQAAPKLCLGVAPMNSRQRESLAPMGRGCHNQKKGKAMKKTFALLASLSPLSALAAQDYSGVQTALTSEVTAAVPVALALFGVIAGVAVGFRVIKRGARG